MPSELITLETSSNIILCPLYFLSMFQEFVVCFAITEEDEETFEYRRICCLRPDPLVFELRPERPVLFELIGQIATRDCWLTALGVENNQDPDDPFASCWVEARPDDISRIYWRSVLPTVEAIINVIPGNVDSTKLISVGRPGAVGTVRLQVIWRPQEGKSIAESLPMYDSRGVRHVPANLDEVPFGRALRFAFTIEYYHKLNDPNSRVIHAHLAHIVPV